MTQVEKQKPIAIDLDGIAFGDAFSRPTCSANGILLLEIKSVENLAPVHIMTGSDISAAAGMTYAARILADRIIPR